MVDIGGGTVLVIGDTFRRLVPLSYLAMALYLGVEASPRRFWNWVYITTFGGFGVASYMILNEPGYSWIPLWATNDLWLDVVLVWIFMIGVLLFAAAIELQELNSPTQAVQDLYDWVCRRIFRN